MILGLAPMDGFTDCAFRIITKEIFEKYNTNSDHSLFLRTEFMSADGYIANPIGVCKHLLSTKFEKNLTLQIHGGNEKNLIKTIVDVQKKYSDFFSTIELNLGCPANNVM
ncbi:MAG: tRNA-dihydrouridine synthase, partial [Candidatus Absconditabacterales bacterium]